MMNHLEKLTSWKSSLRGKAQLFYNWKSSCFAWELGNLCSIKNHGNSVHDFSWKNFFEVDLYD